MKMLFATRDHTQVREVRKMLSEAGIRCQIRRNSQAVFGVHPTPELLIKQESDILRALKVLGSRRLQQMTVVFPK